MLDRAIIKAAAFGFAASHLEPRPIAGASETRLLPLRVTKGRW